MEQVRLPKEVKILCAGDKKSACFNYAVSEIIRLLKRVRVSCTASAFTSQKDVFQLRILWSEATPHNNPPFLKKIYPDGFILKVTQKNILLAARTAKGLLNGVYELAERLGFFFLHPGEDGEWPPFTGETKPLRPGEFRMNPGFKFAGVIREPSNVKDYSMEEWLCFYAKLKFNALLYTEKDYSACLVIARKLGLRLETGGHGLSALLPRRLFDENKELFRMDQPEDFSGNRQNDSNLCVTNPETGEIVRENYREILKGAEGIHAFHVWPDDLPGGGWCLCSSCRGLSPSDQATLVMRRLAEAAAENKSPVRVPVLAYHDTILPGKNISPSNGNFLLFAPRERCYGHAIDDRNCPRNRYYLNALKKWMDRFSGIDDSHIFEYYFDQILFRGIYPFLPEIILRDMRTYKTAGIETYLSLQVGGPAIAPEFNMLALSYGFWNDSISSDKFITRLANKILPQDPFPWKRYLTKRRDTFALCMQICGYDTAIYFDYRWLPENISAFGSKMPRIYRQSSERLFKISEKLEGSVTPGWPERVRMLARKEVARARFEAQEIAVMAFQQEAMNHIGRYWNGGGNEYLRRGIKSLKKAVAGLAAARFGADKARICKGLSYYWTINRWLAEEFTGKIKRYEKLLANKVPIG